MTQNIKEEQKYQMMQQNRPKYKRPRTTDPPTARRGDRTDISSRVGVEESPLITVFTDVHARGQGQDTVLCPQQRQEALRWSSSGSAELLAAVLRSRDVDTGQSGPFRRQRSRFEQRPSVSVFDLQETVVRDAFITTFYRSLRRFFRAAGASQPSGGSRDLDSQHASLQS